MVILLSFIVIILGQKLIPKYINGFKSDAVIRRITFCLMFTVPFFLKKVNIPEQNLNNLIDGVLITIPASLLALAIQFFTWKPYFNKDIIALTAMPKRDFFLDLTSLLLSVIFEELFYRVYIVGLLKDMQLLSILISGGLFSIAHLYHIYRASKFNKLSYFFLLFIGCSYAFAYSITGSIYACLLGHLSYNFPQLINFVLRYKAYRTMEKEVV